MILCRNLKSTDTIISVDDWFKKCPPQGKSTHWKDGRSAKETAKHWLCVIPNQFKELLHCKNLTYLLASPEYVSKFDGYTGNGRNHDLFITAQTQNQENVVVSIESKVDESFDKTVEEYLSVIDAKKKSRINTNADKRINELLSSLFVNPSEVSNSEMKYQLMTAIAGTLAEAKKVNASSAYFIVQTFLSSDMDSKKHRSNQRDLDYFIQAISNGKNKIIHDGDLLGPFNVPGNKYIPDNIDLWIGKYSIRI